jgi:CRP-like cAMP-binding protein
MQQISTLLSLPPSKRIRWRGGGSVTGQIGEILAAHLSCIGQLSPDDRKAVLKVRGEVRSLRRHSDILTAGQVPNYSVVLIRGLLSRYSARQDGTSQIHSFYIAGDTPSLETIHIDYMDHNLGAAVDSTIGVVPHEELHALMADRPNVLSLIWRESLIQAAVFREWLLRNSQLPAHSAMAHLFCEIFVRSKIAGHVDGDSCEFAVTQDMLAAALGLTSVHVNRTLQLLRESGMVEHKGGRLFIHDYQRLAETAEFDPQYLHLRA